MTNQHTAQVPKLRFPGFADEWQQGRVDSFLVLQRGFDLTKKTSGEGKYPVYSSSGISYYHDEFKVRGPGLVTGRKGSVGPVFFVKDDFWPHDTSLWVKDFKGNEVSYCYYFLTQFDLSRFDEASSVPTLNRNNVHREKAAFPTVPEQQKIAAFLTAVDGRIEQLSRKKALLEATKKGVMQQLFTQTLRFQDDHGHDFPDWEEKTLADVVELLSGQHLGPEDYNEDGQGVPYFTGPSDFTSDPSSFTKWTTQNTKIAKPDSVLITVKGNGVGRVMYSTLDQVALGRQLMALRSSSCDNRYLYQYLLTKAQEFVALGSGNLIPGLSRGDILTMALPCPSLPEQTKIAGFLSALDGKIGAVGEQMRQTQAWKKGLLQQLFV